MSGHVLEVEWLDARATVTRAELARVCGLTEPELAELMEYGALHPLSGDLEAARPLITAAKFEPGRKRVIKKSEDAPF